MTEEVKSVRDQIKAELRSYRSLALERRQLEEELDALEKYDTGLKAVNMDGMPRGSGISDPTGREAMDKVTMETHYKMRLQSIREEQMNLEAMLQNLEPIERTLARYRYIKGLSWEEVCVCINYSWRQTHRIHSRVLDQLVADATEREVEK